MDRSEAVRRVKSYSAATGNTFQYVFHQIRQGRRGLARGKEYVYLVSADRKNSFPVAIFVREDAVRRWGKRAGREMTGTEEYAVAKMRLFRAFDEIEDFAAAWLDLAVDDSNLESLLQQLDI